MADLSDAELGAAETLLATMERTNECAFVDPNWLHTAKLLHRMAAEIKRRRAAQTASAECVRAVVREELRRFAPAESADSIADAIVAQLTAPDTSDIAERLAAAESQVATLTARRDELLALVVKVSRETPYPAELDECRSARSALIAEVGTLRAKCDELTVQLDKSDQDVLQIDRERRAAVTELRAEVQELRAQVAPREAQERICLLQIRLDEMREDVLRLNEESRALAARCDDLRAQLSNFSHIETKAPREALIHKSSGFKDTGGRFWVNERGRYGVRYQCKTCGLITLGMYGDGTDVNMHRTDCAIRKPPETQKTPLRPDIPIVDRLGLTVCNCCGCDDGSVRMLSFRWNEDHRHGGGTGISLCLECRRSTRDLLAAEQPHV